MLVKLFNSYVDKTNGGNWNQTKIMCSDVVCDHLRINYSSIRKLNTELWEPEANQQQVQDQFKYLSSNRNTNKYIYSVKVSEISNCQTSHSKYKNYFKDKHFKKRYYNIIPKVVTSTTVLVFNKKRLVIPTAEMKLLIIQWYHHYLQHPGDNRLEETIFSVIYCPGMMY